MKLLILQNSRDNIFELVRDMIGSFWSGLYTVDHIDDYYEAVDAVIRGSHEVCLLDENFGDGRGIEFLLQIRAAGVRMPVILLSDREDRDLDMNFMNSGASDFLIRRALDPYTLERSIRYARQRYRIEEDLRATTTRMFTLINSLNSGILLEGTDRIIQYVNKPFCEMLQIPKHPRDIVGTSSTVPMDGADLRSEEDGVFLRYVQQLIDRNELVLGEELHINDGRILERDFIPIKVGRECLGYLWHYRDITERKRIEESLKEKIRLENMITGLSTRFINLPPEAAETEFLDALGVFGRYLHADRAHIYLFDTELTVAECRFVWRSNPDRVPEVRERVIPLEKMPWWYESLLRFEVLCIPDIGKMPDEAAAEKAILSGVGMKGTILVPIVMQNRPTGVLGFDFFERHPDIDESSLPYLRVLAEIFSNTLERQEIEQALIRSEERYALVVRGASDGIWDWELKEDRIYFSPRWKSTLGFEENEIGEKPQDWFDRVHPDDRKKLQEEIDAHLQQETPYFTNEHRILTKSDRYRWMFVRGMATFDSAGNPVRMAGSQADISNRKEAEEKLRIREQEQQIRLKQMETELLMARKIQLQLLPGGVPDMNGLSVSSVYEPAELLGGDFFDFIVDGDKLGVFLCDVSGHGVPSALIASMIKMSITEIAAKESSPARVLSELNRVFNDKIGHYFITCFYCVLDMDRKSMRYAAGGHVPTLLLRENTVNLLKPGGRIVGPFKDVKFEEEELSLHPGDRLLLYTDGITECMEATLHDDSHSFFGERRLLEFMVGNKDSGDVFLEKLVHELEKFHGNSDFEDDITAVLLDIWKT